MKKRKQTDVIRILLAYGKLKKNLEKGVFTVINDIRFVVADFETTGHSYASGGRIMQAAFVSIEQGEISGRYDTYLNPDCPIPPFIQELTGIKEQTVQAAPSFQEKAFTFSRWMDNSVFVAHNVKFDLTFLNEELKAAGYPPFNGFMIDTVELAKIVLPTAESYKLSDLAELMALNHGQKHRADSDAYATAELFIKLVNRLESFPLVTVEQLLKLSGGLKSDIDLLLTRIAEEKKHHIEELPPQWTVYRGLALRTKEKPLKQKANSFCQFPETKEEVWKLLAEVPGMQERPGQMEMITTVQKWFENQQHAVIEAGTGTGKSLAYLLPAVFESRRTGRSVVVSTYTVLLQHQLLERELAKLQMMLPFPVTAAVLKGKRHYLDLSRFARTLRENEKSYDRTVVKMQLLVWLLETKTGDGDHLNLSSGGQLFWQEVCQIDGYTNKAKQAWRKHDFALYAKEVAAQADVIVTNHSFLIADIKSSTPLLPPGSRIIIDEAHRFEKAARERLGKELSLPALKNLFSKIGTAEDKRLLYHLNRVAGKTETGTNSVPFSKQMAAVLLEAEEWFALLMSYFEAETKTASQAKRQFALDSIRRETAAWQQIEYGAERLYTELGRFLSLAASKQKKWEQIRSQLPAKDEWYIEEACVIFEQCRCWNETLFEFVFRPDEEEVIWLEGDVRSLNNTFAVRAQAVKASGLLQKYLLQRHVILFTSATLTAGGSFQFFANEMGLESDSYQSYVFKSPFQYHSHCRVIVPNDVPDIKETDQESYAQAVADYIIAAAEAAGGRMLVLFTSFDILKKTHDFVQETELLSDYAIIAQGISNGSVTRLIKNFRQYDKAILLGTGALWEGIDIPGEDLSVLFIVRLPFSPPDDPFVAAKSRELKKTGKNPFTAYSLPQAVIRFRQGFGRLIRTQTDRGVAIIFDRRVVSTQYGKLFLESIPDVPLIETDIFGSIDVIEKWLPGEK